jgi:glycerophosphoryl diester phosphodiesterase
MTIPPRNASPQAHSLPPFFDLPTPRVIAHRGLATEVAENTLLAFLRAMAVGAPYLELDVHASSDGVAMVSHDADLKRLTGRDDRVGDLTQAELRRIELGDGQHFVSLAELLDALPDARLNIDIKSAAAVKPTVVAIRLARARDRVLIASFSDKRRRAAVRLLPGVATSASSTSTAFALLGAKLGISALTRRALRGVHAVQVPQSYGVIRIATPRVIQSFQKAGVEVHIWTINDRDTMDRLLDLGIDGLVTDRADVAVRLLNDRSPQNR